MVTKTQNGISTLPVLIILFSIFFVLSAGCFFESKIPGKLSIYRTDSFGTLLWTKNLTMEPNEFGRILVETPQKELLVGSKQDFIIRFLSRVSPTGLVNNTPAVNDTMLLSSIATQDGGKLIYWGNITKLDANGATQWEIPMQDSTHAIQLSNGNYVIDHSQSMSPFTRVACIGQNGMILWDNDAEADDAYGISSIYESPEHTIEITSQHIIRESGDPYPRIMETRQLNFSRDGQLLGKKTFDAAGPLTRTLAGEYVFSAFPLSGDRGYSTDYSNGGKPHIVKLSMDGTLIWDRTLTPSGGNHPLSIIQTSDGGYAVLLLVER